MKQVGLKNNYIVIHDTDTGLFCDAPAEYVFVRKRKLTDTNYDFVYKSEEGILVKEGITLFNIPIAEIESLNGEFTNYNSVSFENWYSLYLGTSKPGIKEDSSVDSFSRLRVSNPTAIFDAQLTYNLQPLLFEQVVSGSGATIAHDSTNRVALMTFSATPTGNSAYMQTYEYFRYQPLKSQLVAVTFNFKESNAECTKFAGYSDGVNGIEFQNDGTTNNIAILSDTDNGDQIIAQSNWNLDTLDGNGRSGFTFDISKTQILIIDFQALYVGRVRVGFDIGGNIVYVHEFTHANLAAFPYIQSANLPIRCGMVSTGTSTTTMNYICSAVSSEGGQEIVSGFDFTASGTATAANGARTHLLSVQPKTTYNSIVNRVKFILENFEILVTGNTPIKWELCIGDVLTGTTTFLDANATYSAFAYNTLGTTSGTPTIVVASGFIPASAQSKENINVKVPLKYPITLDKAGSVRSLGRLTLLVTGLGSTSACQGSMNWKEIR